MALEHVKARNIHHKAHRAGWLRAAVLGANDGLVSTASLMVGVAAATTDMNAVVMAGVAGVAAGAISMAAGEFVSVTSQADIEKADRLMEMEHLAADPEGELEELTEIYIERGVDAVLAREVATQMTAHDALTTHLREELGQHDFSKARPVQAAVASAAAFTAGGLVPFLAGFWPAGSRPMGVVIVTEIGLVAAGLLSAQAAGSTYIKPTLRVVIGGSLAMAITFVVGRIFGAVI